MICLRFYKNTYLSVFKTGSRPEIATYSFWQNGAPLLCEPKELFSRDAGHVFGNRTANNSIGSYDEYSRWNLRERPNINPCVTAFHLKDRLFAGLLVKHHPFICGCGGFDSARNKHIALRLEPQGR